MDNFLAGCARLGAYIAAFSAVIQLDAGDLKRTAASVLASIGLFIAFDRLSWRV